MSQELKKAVALLFRRKGKDALSEKEFALQISMDLRWFSPTEAALLLENAKTAGFVVVGNAGLSPSFDVDDVEISLDFFPSKAVLEANRDEKPVFLRIVEALSEECGLAKAELMAEINRKKEKLRAEIEVAALFVAAERGVDLSGFHGEVEEVIMGRI